MRRWILIPPAALVALAGLTWGVGMLLPVEHTATVTRVVPGTREAVWAVMTTPEAFPEWRPGVERVERLADRDGRPVWRESGPTGAMTLEVTEWRPTEGMVTRIADEGLPFGGTWSYELAPASGGRATRVTLTEDGEVYSPLFRFMARFVFGHEATMRSYLDGLESRMAGAGDEALPPDPTEAGRTPPPAAGTGADTAPPGGA